MEVSSHFIVQHAHITRLMDRITTHLSLSRMDKPFTFRSGYEIPELWYNIASYCQRRTLSNLCMVGKRTFVDPAQRHLYKCLTFNVHGKDLYEGTGQLADGQLEEYEARVLRTTERFAGIAASHLPQYVRDWIIIGAARTAQKPYYDTPLFLHHSKAIPELIATLPQYTRLVSLQLRSLNLDSTTLSAIGTLKTLKKLECDDLLYSCALTLPIPLRLEEYIIRTDYTGDNDALEEVVGAEPGSIFSPDHLKSLSLMYCLAATVAIFTSKILIDHEPHTKLVKLETCVAVEDEDVPRVCNLISSSPLLEVLRVVIETAGVDAVDDELGCAKLDDAACPLLHDLTAPPSFAPVIAPGRPIRRYSMENYDSVYPFFDLDIVIQALNALDANILTHLNFEKTYIDDARELLDHVKLHFSRLQSLRMPINEVDESDSDDDIWTFPVILRHDNVQDQENIDSPGQGLSETPSDDSDDGDNEIVHVPVQFPEGSYLHLLFEIASGNIELPDSLTDFDLCMNHHYKVNAYTRENELTIIDLFSDSKFKNLQKLKFGVDFKNNPPWTRNPQGLWEQIDCED